MAFSKQKKVRENDVFQYKSVLGVAPPIGFEPMTDWLTASRSTGLSHGGTANLSTFSSTKLFKHSH
jgi:hypothetical protein